MAERIVICLVMAIDGIDQPLIAHGSNCPLIRLVALLIGAEGAVSLRLFAFDGLPVAL